MTDPRRVWLSEHKSEMAELVAQVRDQGLTRDELTDVTVEHVMAMTPQPPGGYATALFIAQTLWAETVRIPVPDAVPEWMSADDWHTE